MYLCKVKPIVVNLNVNPFEKESNRMPGKLVPLVIKSIMLWEISLKIYIFDVVKACFFGGRTHILG